MNTILYGIPNCDTVKKARAWLAERGVEVVFHDYKKQGVPEAELRAWVKTLGWETLLNRKGTTWRKLDAARQAAVTDAASAIALMLEQPSVIRRPVLLRGAALRVGFDADEWAALFA
ncbi:MAG: ArsC family reductase [Burkholderiaceae bacterium]|nr:MAG: ArsC family reductase [Burkholderiaceae bacterium]